MACAANAFTLIPTMEIRNVRRINEALCSLEYLSPTALGLRQTTLTQLARHHELKKFRRVDMPMVTPPEKTSNRN